MVGVGGVGGPGDKRSPGPKKRGTVGVMCVCGGGGRGGARGGAGGGGGGGGGGGKRGGGGEGGGGWGGSGGGGGGGARSFQVGNRGVGVCEGPNVRWRIGAWVIAYGVWEVAVGDEHWSLDKCGAEEEDGKESLKSRTDK